MTKYFIALLMSFVAWPSLAADLNGYTAQYECRAGGPKCNVDIATLTSQACQQTITPATTPTNDWSAINWSKNVICIQAGDYTSRGRLYLGSSGTSGTRKVLRYYRANDNNDEPWNQGSNQAKIIGLNTNGQAYWVIHRLTFDANYGDITTLRFNDKSNNIIVNRALIQHANDDLVYFWGSSGSPVVNNTLQNSVVRNSKASTTLENDCITAIWDTNSHIVNNEVYRCNKELFTAQAQDSQGLVAENNDLYDDASQYTDCNGVITPNGPCGVSEAIISMKDGSHTSSNPVKLIHNRVWGARNTDRTIAQSSVAMALSISAGGANGVQMPDGAGASYVLVQNNIFFDSAMGINNYWNGPQNNSIVGNLIYDIHRDHSNTYYEKFVDKGAISFWRLKNTEFYLNTIINTEQWLWLAGSTASDIDARCNVIIDSGAKTGSDGTGFQYDYQAYYGAPDTGEANKIDKSLLTRANSTAYGLGTIIRTGAVAGCVNGTESACFLYKITVAGTSAASAPAYCTTLGCKTTDGTITVEAIRGPYTFYRKLRTKPERYAIPYAKVYVSAPETNSCPGNYASRRSIGINDQL